MQLTGLVQAGQFGGDLWCLMRQSSGMRMAETYVGKFILEFYTEINWVRFDSDKMVKTLRQYVDQDLLVSLEEAHVFNDVRLLPMFSALFDVGAYAGLSGWFSGFCGYDVSWAKTNAYALVVKCHSRDVADSAVRQVRLILKTVPSVCRARDRQVIVYFKTENDYNLGLALLNEMDMERFKFFTMAKRVEVKPLGLKKRPAMNFAACMPMAEGADELVEMLPEVFTLGDEKSKVKLVEAASEKFLVGTYLSEEGELSNVRFKSRVSILRNGQYVKYAPTKVTRNYDMFVDLLIWKAMKVEDLVETLLPKNPLVIWMMKAMFEFSEL